MKMVIIGAGSAFGSRLSVDVLSRGPLNDSTIALCDIDANKLKTVHAYVEKVIKTNNLKAKVVSSTDRTQLLKDADFVVIAVAIGGPAYFGEVYENEIKIPEKYGVKQKIGDTVTPGGIFRALRTAPELISMAEDISRLAPDSIIINYTNPMAILTKVLIKRAEVPVVGLCHSVQGTSKQLASLIGVPYEETGHWVAGINHMAWFLDFTHNGKDAYPQLRTVMNDPERDSEHVRFEIMREFGYFVTESSSHMSEYVPWYQHDNGIVMDFDKFSNEVKGIRQTWYEDMGVKLSKADSCELARSHEYASEIMEAVKTGVPIRFNGSILNKNLITNLPPDSCVEVPCLVDNLGIHPCTVGDLPEQCAALNRLDINVQEMTVKAIVNRDKQTAFQALLLDPTVMATCSIAKAREMFEEMWDAEGDLLEAYGRERVTV